MRVVSALCLSLFAFACGSGGGSGKITGKVSVEGGSTSGIAVQALGPSVSAGATDEGGSFTIEGLRDGWYVVRATVSAAEVPTQEAVVHVEHGTADKEPALTFKVAKGKVTGKVVFSDASSALGLPVTLQGPVSRGTATDMTGAFSLEGLPSGMYVLTIEAANTRERRQSVTFVLDTASASAALPDVPFTATGTVAGTVKDSTMMPISGVEVTVPGTSVRALTDVLGAFELVEVPAGMRSIVATRTGAVTLSAKADVTVVRGTNMPVMLTLMSATPPTGTVSGGVTFFHSGSPELISVTALGSNVSTRVSPLGQYSIDIPAGEWDIVADAPSYPRLVIAHVTVKEGTMQVLPPAHMTLWRRFPQELGVGGVGLLGIQQFSEGDWFLFETTNLGGMPQSWWLANAKTLSRRLYHQGGASPASFSALSRTGQHLAYSAGNATFLLNTMSGAQVSFARTVSQHDFSTDETVYFSADGPNSSLMRYTIASATRRDFAGSAVKLSRDRWLVVNGMTREATLVTPTAEFVVFSNIDVFQVSPLPHVYTGCTMFMSCTVRLLPASATQAVTLGGGTYNYPAALFPASLAYESTGDYAVFFTGTVYRLVKVSDGTAVDLPANTTRVDFNDTGTRVFYVSGPGGNQNLREETLPATGSVTPLATFTGPVFVNWISATRFIAFDEAVGAARRVEVRMGSLTSDPNYIAGSGQFIGPMAHWGRTSDTKRAAVVADASVRPLDLPYPGLSGVTAAAGSEGVGLPGRWGAISENNLAGFKGTFVLDAARDEVRNLSQLRVTAPFVQIRSWYGAHAFSGESGSVLFSNDQFIVSQEPGVMSVTTIPRPTGGWLLATEPLAPPATLRVLFADVPFP